jgi:hypothetical protein
MNEGEYYTFSLLLNELKKFPDLNQEQIKYIEKQLESISPESLRGDSIG